MPNEIGNKWGSSAVPSLTSFLSFKPAQATEPGEFTRGIPNMLYTGQPFCLLSPSPWTKNPLSPPHSHSLDHSGKPSKLNASIFSSYFYTSSPCNSFPELHCRNGSIKICLQVHPIFQMPTFSPLLGPHHPSLPSVSNTSQNCLLLLDQLSPQDLWWAFRISPHPSRLFSPVFLIHSICFHHSFKCRCSLRFIFWLHSALNDVVYHITSET